MSETKVTVDVVDELRMACTCLYLSVEGPIAADVKARAEAVIARCAELEAALRDLYDHQQRISSPDTRWGLPIYQRVRAALAEEEK